MFKHIINPNYVRMLIYLQGKEVEMRELSKNINMDYAFISQRIKHFVSSGVLIKRQKRNIHMISLSEKGKQATQKIIEIKKIMEEK